MTLSAPDVVLSQELRLILHCVQVQVDEAATDRLHVAARQPLDWARFWMLGDQHGLLPLVYWHLVRNTTTPVIPDPWRQRLERAFYLNTARNLQLSAQLRLLLTQLHGASVPAIPLKGIDLSHRLYGNEALRQSGDLDILVPATCRTRAETEVQTQGYVLQRTRPGWVQQQNSRHDSFVHPEHRIYLELHWGLTSAHQAATLDIGPVWARARPGHFDSAPCCRLAEPDLALFLCLHGSKHHWAHLRWLADVALLAAHGGVDWEALLARCAAAGCARMLRLQLHLLTVLFGLPLSQPLQAAIAADRRLPALATQVIANVEAPERYLRANSLQRMAFDASLRERPLDRLRTVTASLLVTAGFHAARLLTGAHAPQRSAHTADRPDG